MALEKVKEAHPVDRAAELAAKSPMPDVAKHYNDDPPIQSLIALCAAFSRLAAGNPFGLGCRDAAAKINSTSYQEAAKMFKTLIADGVLELTREGGAGGRVSEYHYTGRFKWDDDADAPF